MARAAFADEHPNFNRGYDPEKLYQFGEVDNVELFTGGLNVAIPIGIRYPVSERMSYGLTLTYSSSAWDYVTHVYPGSPIEAAPNRESNAGMGWQLGFGKLLHPFDNQGNRQADFAYASPDGGEHRFYSTLHNDDTATPGVQYTRDGSYLRLQSVGVDLYDVEFGDGTIQRFEPDPWTADTGDFRLKETRDRFVDAGGHPRNWVRIDYATYGTWTVTDSQGRTHFVRFRSKNDNGSTKLVVDEVELDAFGNTTALFDFVYPNDPGAAGSIVPRDCRDLWSDPQTVETPLLTSVSLLSGGAAGTWTMGYSLNADRQACTMGRLAHLGLPTGGSIDYTYGWWPQPSEEPCSEDALGLGVIGITSRTIGDPTPSGEGGSVWTYSAIPVSQPGNTDFCPNPEWQEFPFEELRVTVMTPLKDKQEHFFSIWPGRSTSPNGFVRPEYGLPITHLESDGAGRFLSTRISECDDDGANCTPKRSVYLKYEYDDYSAGGLMRLVTDRNRRVQEKRTTYHETSGDLFVDEVFSDFDGLGHYRNLVRSSNFPDSPARTERTGYNLGVGTYPGLTWTMLPATSPWVLGMYHEALATETVATCSGSPASETQTAKTETCFDPATGFLKWQRTLAAATGQRGATDLLHLFDPDPDGNVEFEKWFGGDSGGIDTTSGLPICSLPIPATAAYRANHGYSYGVRSRTEMVQSSGATEPSVKVYSLDQDVDPGTGLVARRRTASGPNSTGLATQLSYDGLGRLTQVRPLGATGTACESYSYLPFTSASLPARVAHEVWSATSGTSCAGTLLARELDRFTGFGRLHRQARRGPDNQDDERYHFYNRMGWKSYVSEWGDESDGTTADYGTEYGLFDPFGRARQISRHTPTTSVVEVGLEYSGVRQVKRTTGIGDHVGGDGLVYMSSVDSFERFDSSGRLVEAEEPSSCPASDSCSTVVTKYAYDVGGRMKRAFTDLAGVASDELRCWTYDQRGFLASERHPEKGASGNGTVSYTGYDALGNATAKSDGGVSLTFEFDPAGRLAALREHSAGDRLLKEWLFATSNAGSNYRLGRVDTARSYNYRLMDLDDNGALEPVTVHFDEIFTYAGPGGRADSRSVQLVSDTALLSPLGPLDKFAHSEVFDPAGERTQIHYPDCVIGHVCTTAGQLPRTVVSEYSRGFLSKVTDWTGTILYHPNGMWREIPHAVGAVANGVVDHQVLDPNRRPRPARLETVAGGSTVLFGTGDFGYDLAGNIWKMGPLPGGTASQFDRFVYDHAGRLRDARMFTAALPPAVGLFADGFETGDPCEWTSVEPAAGCSRLGGWPDAPASPLAFEERSQKYAFDVYGNLTEIRTFLGTTLTDDDDWPTKPGTNQLASSLATYDGRGNLSHFDDPDTAADPVDYEFDALDRMASRKVAGQLPYYFFYTADDERILVFVNQPTGTPDGWSWTLRDLGGKVLRDLHTTPERVVVDKDYIYRGDQLLGYADYSEPELSLVHLSLDHLGTPRLETDAETGAYRRSAKYYPFGQEIIPASDDALRLRFTGHERDTFAALIIGDETDYLHARFRSPLTGRFVSVDPVLQAKQAMKMPQLWNRYSYGVGNPMKYVDPDGRRLQALDERALRLILATLPREIRAAVQSSVSKTGHFDAAKINAIKNESKNFTALKATVDSKQLVTASTAKQVSFQDVSGRRQSEPLIPGAGITLTPLPPTNRFDDSTTGFSLSGNIDVVVFGGTGGLSTDDARAMAHELFGHAKLYVEGQPFMHDQIPGEADFQDFEDEVNP